MTSERTSSPDRRAWLGLLVAAAAALGTSPPEGIAVSETFLDTLLPNETMVLGLGVALDDTIRDNPVSMTLTAQIETATSTTIALDFRSLTHEGENLKVDGRSLDPGGCSNLQFGGGGRGFDPDFDAYCLTLTLTCCVEVYRLELRSAGEALVPLRVTATAFLRYDDDFFPEEEAIRVEIRRFEAEGD